VEGSIYLAWVFSYFYIPLILGLEAKAVFYAKTDENNITKVEKNL